MLLNMFGSLYLETAVIYLRIALYTYYAIGVDIWLTHTFHQPQPLYKILPCHFRDSLWAIPSCSLEGKLSVGSRYCYIYPWGDMKIGSRVMHIFESRESVYPVFFGALFVGLYIHVLLFHDRLSSSVV